MGNKIVQFSNAEFGNVRVMLIEGKPWFVGKDVADRARLYKPAQSTERPCARQIQKRWGNDS